MEQARATSCCLTGTQEPLKSCTPLASFDEKDSKAKRHSDCLSLRSSRQFQRLAGPFSCTLLRNSIHIVIQADVMSRYACRTASATIMHQTCLSGEDTKDNALTASAISVISQTHIISSVPISFAAAVCQNPTVSWYLHFFVRHSHRLLPQHCEWRICRSEPRWDASSHGPGQLQEEERRFLAAPVCRPESRPGRLWGHWRGSP